MWYTIGYGVVALLFLLVPAISGSEIASKNPGSSFTMAVFWPFIMVFYGSEWIVDHYGDFAVRMKIFWDKRKQKRMRVAEERLRVEKQLEEDEDEWLTSVQERTKDYRRTHCHGCGKIV